jgi:hypothetical protein
MLMQVAIDLRKVPGTDLVRFSRRRKNSLPLKQIFSPNKT